MLDPSPPSGPSLVALRAFEAAARCGSFSRAADELHVTPAAVAQHVKALEAWAQQPLFDRTARGVTLNDAGVRARPALTDAFRRLDVAAGRLREGNPRRRTVRFAALPAIAELWISPRLAAVPAALESHDLAIHAVDRKPDLSRDGFDVTAYFEPTAGPSDELVLVAAPAVAAALTTIDDLSRTVRLVDRAWEDDWHRWLGADHAPAPGRVVEVSLFSMAVSTAVAGHGTVVGRRSLLAEHLRRGVLVEPFTRRVATGDRLTIERRDDPELEAFSAWIEP